MVVGEKFTRNGKTYVVTQVWGENFGFREADPVEEVKEEVKEEAVIEEPVIKTRRRKKA